MMDQPSSSPTREHPNLPPGVLLSSMIWLNHPEPLLPAPSNSRAERMSDPCFCASSGETVHTINDLANRMRERPRIQRRLNGTASQGVFTAIEPELELESDNKRRFREVFGSKNDGSIYTCEERLAALEERSRKRQKLDDTTDETTTPDNGKAAFRPAHRRLEPEKSCLKRTLATQDSTSAGPSGADQDPLSQEQASSEQRSIPSPAKLRVTFSDAPVIWILPRNKKSKRDEDDSQEVGGETHSKSCRSKAGASHNKMPVSLADARLEKKTNRRLARAEKYKDLYEARYHEKLERFKEKRRAEINLLSGQEYHDALAGIPHEENVSRKANRAWAVVRYQQRAGNRKPHFFKPRECKNLCNRVKRSKTTLVTCINPNNHNTTEPRANSSSVKIDQSQPSIEVEQRQLSLKMKGGQLDSPVNDDQPTLSTEVAQPKRPVVGLEEYESMFLPAVIESPQPATHRHAKPNKSCLKTKTTVYNGHTASKMYGFMYDPPKQSTNHHIPQQHGQPSDNKPQTQRMVKFTDKTTCLDTKELYRPHNRDRREWKQSGKSARRAWRKSGKSYTEAMKEVKKEGFVLELSLDDSTYDFITDDDLLLGYFWRTVYEAAYGNGMAAFIARWKKSCASRGQEPQLQSPDRDLVERDLCQDVSLGIETLIRSVTRPGDKSPQASRMALTGV
ncbi:hypothetical protein QBC41DRAFT_341593 [Cercophora samala]|uniref:Uncharacterized protein n=1 Tax=Cercophora samala TaxID=330535 RepID=A0AA39YTG5_9PEZI|nr:hypothetical protein QBC41DRAFT_341593 [Cercophora samala]